MQHFVVLVSFTTSPSSHAEALSLIDDYVDSFLSQQPGFVRSYLNENEAHTELVHFAMWENEAAFRAFAEKAQNHPALEKIRSYAPSPAFYSSCRSYGA